MEIEQIRRVIVTKRYRFREHAEEQLDARHIFRAEVEEAILEGEIIEEYPDHHLGPCCLIYGRAKSGRYLHIVVSLPPDCWIITAYEPDPAQWIDRRRRRTSQ